MGARRSREPKAVGLRGRSATSESLGAGAPGAARADWQSIEARAAFLATVRLFAHLPRSLVEDMAARLRARPVERGAFVFLEGEPARSLNLLAEGQIKVISETADGREVILRLIKPGEIFGAAAGWGEPIYPASAVAQQPSVVLQLPARDFTALITSQPHFALAVVRELGTRLREVQARLSELQTASAEQRLARTLLRLADKASVLTPAGIELALTLTRQELGELAGITLSTASRTLRAWARRGLIVAGRKRIVLCQREALVAIAGGATASDEQPTC